MHSNVKGLTCFLTFCSAIVFAADAGKTGLQAKNVVLQVRDQLLDPGRHLGSPLLDSLANQVLAGLPAYQQQLDRAFNPANSRLNLDIILMSHGTLAPDNTVRVNRSELDSQKAAAELLEMLQPELIGFEGAPGDPLTFKSLAQDIIDANLALGKVIVPDQAQAMVRNWTEHDGALRYYQAHPDARLTGMEETPVYLLALMLQQLGTQDPLLADLNRLRGELGIAKTINQLHQNSLSRGAIVVGYAHEADYRQILAKLPISSRFYQTPATRTTVATSRYLQK